MNRRKYLAISGGMVALAGCSGDSNSDQSEEEPEEEEAEEDNQEQEEETEPEQEQDSSNSTEEETQEEPEETIIFTLSNLSPTEETYKRGDEIEIEATVENEGNTEGTKQIEVEFQDEVVNTEEITLEPNGTLDYSYQLDTSDIDQGEHDIQVSTEDDELDTTITINLPDDEIMEMFELQLEVFGLNLVDHSIESEELHIHYETTSVQSQEILNDMMNVEEVYYSAILQGISTDRLVAEMSEPNAEPVGRFRIENEWSHQYSDDEITEAELERKIQSTLEQL